MRFKIFIFFFTFCNVLLFGQDCEDLNQNQNTKIARCITEYERLIKYYRYYKQDSAIYFASRAMALAKKMADSSAVASVLVQMGMIDDNQGEFDASVMKYKRALAIFRSANSESGLATINIRIGVVELRNGKYDKALEYFFEALKLSEKSENKAGIMEAYYSISWAYLDQNDYDESLQYLIKAEKISESLPFSNISLNILNHMGVIYRNKKDFEKAKQFLERGVQLSNEKEYQGLNITIINNLASVYALEGNKRKAITLQKEALARSRSIGNYLRELQTLSGLAKTYGNDDPEKAIHYLKQAIFLARQKSSYKHEMRFLKLITPIFVSTENYKQAFLMKEREHALADSFLYQSVSQNVKTLKAEYELSKSNARIKELDLLNSKYQLEVEHAAFIRNVTFAGLILLLVILALLYNQNCIRRRANDEIKKKNKALHRLVDDKEWLLKEIHHRVKNNLQTVVSLLESQSVYLKDDALLANQDSQNRVHAMSLIHQKLYQSENVASINMTSYLHELVNYLQHGLGINKRIRFSMTIQSIDLDVSQAVPVGLILNEAITNSIKYAFPADRESKEISITMTKSSVNQIYLSVSDNGIGIPDGVHRSGNLGLKLMKGLTEDISGEFVLKTESGTTIEIYFLTNPLLHDIQESNSIST